MLRSATGRAAGADEGFVMRRTAALLTVLVAMLLLASGVALAAVFNGTPGDDLIEGTNQNDTIYGYGGNDYLYGTVTYRNIDSPSDTDKIYGGVGNDLINPQLGADSVVASLGNDLLADGPIRDALKDTLSGGDGADNIVSNNYPRATDVISCGAGIDWVKVDSADTFLDKSNCEKIIVHNPTSATDAGPLAPYQSSATDPRSRARFR